MQRYFIQGNLEAEQIVITGDDQHHIEKVMRMRAGDEIICVDPLGKSAICSIANFTDESVVVKIVQLLEGSSELPVKVIIASGLPKGDKLELIIQKGTELGAYEFVPFAAARSVVKWDEKKASKKLERWQKICKEAAEQSHRSYVPTIKNPVTFKRLMEISADYQHKLVAYEEGAKSGEQSAFASMLTEVKKGESLFVVFGPEGGLSSEEIEELQDNGFRICGLGPRILRTETAPLYTLSAVSYHFELMG